MIDVGLQKHIYINWKLFSLKLINMGRKVREDFQILHEIGLKALRVAAAVRSEFGNDRARKIYTYLGARYQHYQEDIDDPAVMEGILQKCGFPTNLAASIDDKTWENDIIADMDHAIAKAGSEVGVPLIVLDGGKGPGFFGPVMSPAPTGKQGVKFWDAIIAAGSTPGFFELKRTRDIGPIFGERPKV